MYVHIYNCKHTYKGIYEGPAHAIMEAEKFHDLLSVSWRLRKTAGGIPV